MSVFEHRHTIIGLAIDPPVLTSQMVGNEVRTVLAVAAEVWTLSEVHRYVTLYGRQRKNDGTLGRGQQIGWIIGGHQDQSTEAPPVVHAAVAAASRCRRRTLMLRREFRRP